MHRMLSFEELAVLLSLEESRGVSKSQIAHSATQIYCGYKFDRHVALRVVDSLLGQQLIVRDTSGSHFLSRKGLEAISKTKLNTNRLLTRLTMHGY